MEECKAVYRGTDQGDFMKLTSEQITEINERYLPYMPSDDHAEIGDTERIHELGDEVLVRLIRELGLTEIAEAWDRLPKWYA